MVLFLFTFMPMRWVSDIGTYSDGTSFTVPEEKEGHWKLDREDMETG